MPDFRHLISKAVLRSVSTKIQLKSFCPCGLVESTLSINSELQATCNATTTNKPISIIYITELLGEIVKRWDLKQSLSRINDLNMSK
ncbi:MAG: hypothetical protein AB8B37_09045, partial [Prochlorococcus sp.]